MAEEIDSFGSRRSTVYARNGVVATSQPLASSAGIRMLQRGGNAFDAAVATAAALNVVEPTSTGLGGDVFAIYRTAGGEVGAIRACGSAPSGANIDRVRKALADEQGVGPQEAEMPLRGPHTVTVPGTARGWEKTVNTLGELCLSDVLKPAIRYATEGYPVSEVIAEKWREAEEILTQENARDTYLLDGRAPRNGEIIRIPELGKTLQAIGAQGADVVYEGYIGEAIVNAVQNMGGFLSSEDMANFEVEFVEPESTTYRNAEVYELPPNNQGLIVLEALNIASSIEAGDTPYDSTDRVHGFVEAMKLAFHDGHYYITDPKYDDIPNLASNDYAACRAHEIGEEALDPTNLKVGKPNQFGEKADTVLLAVADAEGNLVSYINSRYHLFGSGIVAGDTGIALQNRGSSFSLDNNHPNRLEPNKRPFHTLIPGLVHLADQDWAAFGVMGGYMQPQGHVQVLANILNYDMTLQQALDAPRWRYLENGRLAVEARMPINIQNGLSRKGHDLTVFPPKKFGGGQIVRITDNVLSAATEPRKDGVAIGF